MMEAACKGCAADSEGGCEGDATNATFDLGFSPGGNASAKGPHVILRLEAETAAETRVRLVAQGRFSQRHTGRSSASLAPSQRCAQYAVYLRVSMH